MSSTMSVPHIQGLDQRVVLVTGAASGIGAATAGLLLNVGARVVAVDWDEAGLVRAFSGQENVVAVRADASAEDDVRDAIAHCQEMFGRLDGVVANAAVTRAGTAEEMDPATWDLIMAVNLKSVYLAAHFGIPVLRASGGGSFVAVASQVGLVGYPRNVAYCAAKGGVINLIRALAIDHAHEGVRFNSVCPGPIDTPMLAEGFRQTGETATVAGGRVPMSRVGTPMEIATVIAFLLSPASSYTTGAAWVSDGGYTAQ
jgi:meso-butanediol dehydrogenase/(S,S)-butanediol dehydrogenase/diacetyl reductase